MQSLDRRYNEMLEDDDEETGGIGESLWQEVLKRLKRQRASTRVDNS